MAHDGKITKRKKMNSGTQRVTHQLSIEDKHAQAHTALSIKVDLQTRRGLRDNVESDYG